MLFYKQCQVFFKEKLKKVKRSFTPNSDKQQFVRNSRTEYNPVTHKLTDYTEGEVEDKIKAIEELELYSNYNLILVGLIEEYIFYLHLLKWYL